MFRLHEYHQITDISLNKALIYGWYGAYGSASDGGNDPANS